MISISLTDDRTRLSGMQIKGDGHLIYEDRSQKTSCYFLYPLEGTDVCSDVIRIPLNGTSVRNLTISTNNYLTLCEVQVFGGIEFIFSFQRHLTYKPIFNTSVVTITFVNVNYIKTLYH